MKPMHAKTELEQMRRELKGDSEPLTHGEYRKLLDVLIEFCEYLDVGSSSSGLERDIRQMLERPDLTGRLP